MVEHGKGRFSDPVRVSEAEAGQRGVYIDSAWLTDADLRDYEAHERLYPEVPRSVIHLVAQQLDSESVAAFYARMRGVMRPWVLNVLIRTEQGRVLRIRMYPQVHEHLSLAAEAYSATSVVERRARNRSKDTPEQVIAKGTQKFNAHIVGGGFDSFGAWMSTLLSAEGMAWYAHPWELKRPSQAVGPLSTLLLGVHGLREDSAPLMAALSEHSVFADLLEQAEQDTAVTRTILPALAQAASSVGGQDHDHVVLANSGMALQKLAARMDGPLLATARSMVAIRRQVNRVRMAVVAAHVVGESLGWETLGRIGSFRGQVDPDLAALCRATEQVVSEMAVEAATLAEELGPLATSCTASLEALAEFHRWVKRYRLMVSRIPDATNLSDLTEALDRHLASAEGGPLENVASASQALHVGYDVESLVGHLHDIRGAAVQTEFRNWPGVGFIV